MHRDLKPRTAGALLQRLAVPKREDYVGHLFERLAELGEEGKLEKPQNMPPVTLAPAMAPPRMKRRMACWSSPTERKTPCPSRRRGGSAKRHSITFSQELEVGASGRAGADA